MRIAVSGRVVDKNVGGNTRYVRNLYARMERLGVTSHLLRAPKWAEHGRTRSATYAALESAVWPRLGARDCDLLHYPADTGAVVPGKLPVVSTIHGIASLHIAGSRNPVSSALWLARVRAMAARSDRIITVSESSARDIAKLFPRSRERIRVIYHGIDHDIFNTIRVSRPYLEGIRLPEEYFLYVGNLDPRKNLIALATAADAVFESTGIPLVVGGAPAWEAEQILSRLRSSRGVVYVGRVPEAQLVPLMQNATAFCFPSLYEGFGFPVLEAMACGTPVICSNRGSLDEIATGHALVLKEPSSQEIAGAMMKVARDDSMRTDLRNLGLRRAATFTWERSAMLHLEVFKEVA